MGNIDLHVHSNASDGSCTPAELLKIASEKQLAAIALTDHDTVSGIEEFLRESARYDLDAVPGLEVSVLYKDSAIHITGLFIDHKNQPLMELLGEVRENRDKRNELIIGKLQELGYEITLDEVLGVASGESIGRPHFAKILVEKGYFSYPQEVFDKCLKKGMSGYCPRMLPDPERAIKLIHEAGGMAFWAHPVHRADENLSYVESVLNVFVKLGLDGIEAYYSTFTREQQEMLLRVAEKYNLAVSGGSDFHGENMPGVEMGSGFGGLAVPFSIYGGILGKRKTGHST